MHLLTPAQKDQMISLFKDVQKSLLKTFEEVDGTAKAVLTSWDRPEGGGGTIGVIRGHVVEKAGANVSIVHGTSFPNVDKSYAGQPFFAAGVSTITHMHNPYAPIGHMNIRVMEVKDGFWVGGGGDLTPFKVFDEDTKAFHKALKEACDAYHPEAYVQYSKWCDEYFYIKHRQSIRGVGGIFFDDLKGDFDKLYGFIKATAFAYVNAFGSILHKRKEMPFTPEEKDAQLYWRGRYAEFNLVYDKGTKFGLLSGGNNDAIFVSMPPVVKW